MKNSGYVAVGHILASKEPQDYVKTLRYFCSVIFVNLKEDMVCKSHGFGLYDKFMSTTTRVTLSTFSKFLSGMLMNHGTDELDFQLKVRIFKLYTYFEQYLYSFTMRAKRATFVL